MILLLLTLLLPCCCCPQAAAGSTSELPDLLDMVSRADLSGDSSYNLTEGNLLQVGGWGTIAAQAAWRGSSGTPCCTL
jgi:hypothetical protein